MSKFIKLGEVAYTTSGGTPPRGNKLYYGGDIPWVKSGELPDGEITTIEEKITALGLEQSSAKLLDAGTLLIAMYGATVGKLGILKFPAATNQAVCAIVPDARLDTQFLFYRLLHIRQSLIEASFGGAQPNINQGIIREIEIPLIPTAEQKAIASALTAQLAEVEQAKTAAQKQLEELKQIPPKLLSQSLAVGDLKPLGSVCEGIIYGVTASAVTRQDGPRFLRITDIKVNGVDWESVPGCEISKQEHSKAKLLDGDIVVARTGGTVGKSYLVSSPPDAVCASYLLRLRPNRSKVLPDYLQLFLQSSAYWEQLYAAAQGAAQPNVNGTTLSQMLAPVPTLDIQQRTVNAVKPQIENAQKAALAAQKQIDDLNLLPQKLLAQVFEN